MISAAEMLALGTRRFWLWAWLVLPLVWGGSGLARGQELVVLTGQTMGTSYHIKYVGPAVVSQKALDAVFASVNQEFSTYLDDSTISRFNRSPVGSWFAVSPRFVAVLQASHQVWQATAGAFDPSIGFVVDQWGFGHRKRQSQLPPGELTGFLAKIKPQVGWPHIKIREAPPAIQRTSPYAVIDLSGIVKGSAVDEAAALLRQHGVKAAMVEVGGEVVTFGRKPDGSLWRLGIERPALAGREIQQVVQLPAVGMATSGNYRNYYEKAGKRYTHVIDPGTLAPITHRTAAVTVVAASCQEADALATALLVMGQAKGLAWAEAHNVAAYFIYAGDAGFATAQTTGFKAYLLP